MNKNPPVFLWSIWCFVSLVLSIDGFAQPTSRHALQLGTSFFVQSKVDVKEPSGPLTDVTPRLGIGVNTNITYKYSLIGTTSWIGAAFEIGAFHPSIQVNIPELTLPSGEVLPAYSEITHPGFISGLNWYWTLIYGRSYSCGKSLIEPYIGAGTVETELRGMHESLGRVSSTTHRGVTSLFLSYHSRRAITFRMGMDLILPKRKRHSWSLGLVAVMTGTYVTGGYWLMPETIYESHGFYSGAMSYAGIRITRQFEFGREKVE